MKHVYSPDTVKLVKRHVMRKGKDLDINHISSEEATEVIEALLIRLENAAYPMIAAASISLEDILPIPKGRSA